MVNISDRTDFTCQASGYPLPQVVWSRDETEGPGLTIQQGVIEMEQGEQVAGGKGREGGREGGREEEREGGREGGRKVNQEEKCGCRGRFGALCFRYYTFIISLSFSHLSLSPSLSSSLPPSHPTVEVDATTVRNILTFFNVIEEDTGTYRCTVSNINSTVTSTASLQLFGREMAGRGREGEGGEGRRGKEKREEGGGGGGGGGEGEGRRKERGGEEREGEGKEGRGRERGEGRVEKESEAEVKKGGVKRSGQRGREGGREGGRGGVHVYTSTVCSDGTLFLLLVVWMHGKYSNQWS